MDRLPGVLLDSLFAAGLYAAMAWGLAVIYGVMRIINLAHAGVMMLGAYATLALSTRFGLDPFLSLLLVCPAFFALGNLFYRLVVRRLPRAAGGAASMESLLLLFGVWLILQNLAYAIWSGDTQSILTPYTMKGVGLLGARVGMPTLLVFLMSALSLVALQLLLKKSRVGRAIRAVTQNRDAALLSGVDAERISAAAFGLGTAFAAGAGTMLASLYAFTPEFGRTFLLKSFCIIVLGGMESVAGVAAGAFVLALLENALAAYTSVPTAFQDAVSFTLLVLVLVVLPQGIPSLFRRRMKARIPT